MKTLNLASFSRSGAILLCASALFAAPCFAGPRPNLTGKLIFQRSTPAQNGRPALEDAELYLFDFGANTFPNPLVNLSKGWNLSNSINANLSPDGLDRPDGQAIVFAAKSPTGERDIFYWSLDSKAEPTNLTAGNGERDEDPRFDPSGQYILFKQSERMAIMDSDRNVSPFSVSGSEAEVSGPCFAADGKHILFWEGAKGESDIYSCNLKGKERTPLAATPGVQEYYPTPWTRDLFLYTRWLGGEGPTGHNDQIFSCNLKTGESKSLPFNQTDSESADPCPIDDTFVIFSSTRKGGIHHLYVGNVETGDFWALSEWSPEIDGQNQQELGATYTP